MSPFCRSFTIAALAAFALVQPDAAGDKRSAPARAGIGSTVEVTRRKVIVYAKPAARRRGKRGVVARRARFRVLESARGPGCRSRWLRIGKRAWICSRATRPTSRSPSRTPRPLLPEHRKLPHSYIVTREARAYRSLARAVRGRGGKTIGGVGGFIRRRTARRDGRRFFKTPRGWVASEEVERVDPIDFRAIELDPSDRGKRLAFVVRGRARLYDDTGRELDEAGPRRQHYLGAIGEPIRRRGKALYAIGPNRYVRGEDIGRIEWTDPPEEMREGARWLDVSLSQQTMVAYQGERPLFATLVSTGKSSTPSGVFRIKKKRAFGRLRSLPGSTRQWDVHVPWVMSLKGRIAMHPAYWHEKFGTAYSAGCINLSPIDAKRVWDFTEPRLPAGWVRVRANPREQGTIVRIRP